MENKKSNVIFVGHVGHIGMGATTIAQFERLGHTIQVVSPEQAHTISQPIKIPIKNYIITEQKPIEQPTFIVGKSERNKRREAERKAKKKK
jgi:hypothetical protein